MKLDEVRDRVAAAAERGGRSPAEITLVAVSKGQPLSAVEAAYELGQRDFGESRAQELVSKIPHLPNDSRWHFIGPLQRNKVRLVRPSVVLLQSLDRVSLAAAWLKGPGVAPPALLQINIGREPQKSGVDPTDTQSALAEMRALGVDVQGVMAIPPYLSDGDQLRPYFRELVELRDSLAAHDCPLPIVSMGMTDDYEVAIEEGSTMIRVGRAIFGERTR